jgi:Dna[CI] antecedent, DciA
MFSLKQILGQHASLKPQNTTLKSQDAVLKSLAQQLNQQQRFNKAWQSAAPELQHYSQATSVEGSTLIVVAESGLVANKIKLLASQLIPTLNQLINVNCLPTQRHNLTAIRVKVQAKSLLKQGTKRITGLSKVASEELASFAQTTKNEKLAEAIKKLSSHRR